MIILSLDTSSESASCALLEITIEPLKPEAQTSKITGIRLLSEYFLNTGMRRHSQTIAPMIDTMLKNAGIAPENLGKIACTVGPGSFTGIRIGISTAKAMAYGLGAATAGVSTLDALAANAIYYEGLLCPMLDARNAQVYGGIYLNSTEGLSYGISECRAQSLDEMASRLSTLCKKTGRKKLMLMGSGYRNNPDFWHAFAKQANEQENICVRFADSMDDHVKASVVGRLAAFGHLDIHPKELKPQYMRETQAERIRRS
ncbi:MAG TPA: tRNA (adenosine(37)-N6)-threonylcarbamoyltransferase complex dimerization subunit type 1 TsaB [Clostridiales bacterium]|nr:tRNA (adenosine(37)-N6)-threonylcarbamoyltransferase complex dimerization subunit type 1 TsaB [Clostridiales bacterium]